MHCYNKSLSWNFDLLEKLEAVKLDCENAGRIFVRLEKNRNHMQQRLKKESAIEISSRKKRESEFFLLHQKQRSAESERRNTQAVVSLEHQRTLEEQWKKVWRSCSHDRSCYGDKKKVFWKLDPSENSLRMRMKLKRNYHGTHHKEAVHSTFKPKENDEKEEVNQVDNSEELLKALSSIHITVLPKKDEDVLEEFDFEDNDLEEAWCIVDQSEVQDITRVSEKILFTSPCTLVDPLTVSEGTLVITASKLHFLVNRSTSKKQSAKDKKWSLKRIALVQRRRYLLRDNALEIFFTTQRSYLFNFPNNMRNKFLQNLSRSCPGKVEGNRSPAAILKRSGWTQKWVKREISNFEYLMHLNTIAGRTYNDLTQYPVFPWILQDYESKQIDLSKPSVYRDLSRPIGALNEKRLQRFRDRYEAFDDPNIPKFLYGSHYSSIGSVLFFMLRLEPFTTQFLENLQGGRFDIPDRLFYSLPSAWNNCLQSPSDVKELTPEFFYLPEFLRNSNEFDLGVKQDGERVNDVELPPWAKTPEEFIKIHREALESEYVSQHLHEWINLIFGYKQKGKAAEAADNVFYYLTYEGAVDVDAIEDPVERAAIESQIANFGQTPSQLLTVPHPKRDPPPSIPPSLFGDHLELTPHLLLRLPFAPSELFLCGEEIVAISAACEIAAYRPSPERTEAYFFVESSHSNFPNAIQEVVRPPFIMFPNDTNTLIACSKWDYSFRVIDKDSGNVLSGNSAKTTQIMNQHKDRVTCFAVSEEGSFLVSGSSDTTLALWPCRSKGKSVQVGKKPRHILRGHDDEVTCVCLSVDLDVCVSGSKDTTAIIHTLKEGRYVRSIRHPNGAVIHRVALSPQGYIAIYSSGDNNLHLYNINGRLLYSMNAGDLLCAMQSTRDGEYLVTAGKQIIVRRFSDLSFVMSIPVGLPSRIVSISLDEEGQRIYAILENQNLILFAKQV